jgi:hypothetical protein
MPGLGKANSRLAAFLAQEGGRRSGSKSDTHIGRDWHLILITITPLETNGTYKKKNKDWLGLTSTGRVEDRKGPSV